MVGSPSRCKKLCNEMWWALAFLKAVDHQCMSKKLLAPGVVFEKGVDTIRVV